METGPKDDFPADQSIEESQSKRDNVFFPNSQSFTNRTRNQISQETDHCMLDSTNNRSKRQAATIQRMRNNIPIKVCLNNVVHAKEYPPTRSTPQIGKVDPE